MPFNSADAAVKSHDLDCVSTKTLIAASKAEVAAAFATCIEPVSVAGGNPVTLVPVRAKLPISVVGPVLVMVDDAITAYCCSDPRAGAVAPAAAPTSEATKSNNNVF